jgi:MFS family permease
VQPSPLSATLPTEESSYRWVILTASWVTLAVTAGLVFFSLPVYLAALAREPGLPLGQLSVATSFFYVVLGLVGVPVGRVISRWDVRWVMSAGALLGWFGFFALGKVSTTLELMGAYAVLATSFAMVSFVPLTTVVFRWFRHRRGLAMTILMSGQAAGGSVVTPVVNELIHGSGLGAVAFHLGHAYLAVAFLASVALLRPFPPAATVDGAHGHPERSSAAAEENAASAKMRGLLALCVAMSFIPCATVGTMNHLTVLGAERAIGGHAAMVPLFAVASGVGSFGVLALLRRSSATAAAGALAVMQTAAVLLLSVAFTTAPFAVGSLTLGLGLGGFLVLMPLVLLELYPARHYARLYAKLTLWTNVGVAVGPGAIGLLHTWAGRYQIPLLLTAAAPALSAYLLRRISHGSGCSEPDGDDHGAGERGRGHREEGQCIAT